MKNNLWALNLKRSLSAALCVGALLTLGAMQAQAYHIGDRVWIDANCNGIQDPGEVGLNGVTVELRSCADHSLICATTTTDDPDGPGYYRFGTPTPCELHEDIGYYVKFILPAGYHFTTPYVGSDTTVDSNADANGESHCITFDINYYQKDYTIDAGLCLNPSPGTGTPGYWMNHPDAWPVDSIVVGGIPYTKAEAIILMKLPVAKDKRLTMFPNLVCAKLNLLIGNDGSCVTATIASADTWWATFNASPVAAKSAAWQLGGPLATTLDQYNGLLCAPHRN